MSALTDRLKETIAALEAAITKATDGSERKHQLESLLAQKRKQLVETTGEVPLAP